MFSWFEGWSDRAKLALTILVISLAGLLLSLWLGGFVATLLVVLPGLYAILKAIAPALTPASGGGNKVALTSLGIAALATLSAPAWRGAVNTTTAPLLNDLPESIRQQLIEHRDAPSMGALLVLAIIIIAVNYFARDRTALGVHPTPTDLDFPERRFPERLERYAKGLLRELEKIDLETNWTDEHFVPLDAEVEIREGPSRRRKLTDLLGAIRNDTRSKVFLVLGDPGAGKSVALRQLCRELLRETRATGKLPIYINLREWDPPRQWTAQDVPTGADLYAFVFSNLKARADVFGSEFLDLYFKKMLDRGRLFLVLDSFDEMPAVLDVDERSWLVEALSNALDDFLIGTHESRGLVASRLYRKPTEKLGARAVLEIRPLTEAKIVDLLGRSLFKDREQLTGLFRLRQDLLGLARNPFTASLIVAYLNERPNEPPETQAELYRSYIERRLRACAERMAEQRLTADRVLECAVEFADAMFTTETFGLEAAVSSLTARLPQHPVEAVVDLLLFARLGRGGSGLGRRFAFVHRRFNEYFLVQKLKREPHRVPAEAIPTDSRFRDALVLYCEVADAADATRLAEFSWQCIATAQHAAEASPIARYSSTVHSLRFLSEAFKTRLSCIAGFRSELGHWIDNVLVSKESLLLKKVAVEAIGLLDQDAMSSSLIRAARLRNAWIDETAFRSCRYIASAPRDLTLELCRMVNRIPWRSFLRTRRELTFVLSLSDALREVRTFSRMRFLYAVAAGVATAVLLALNPVLVVITAIFVVVFYPIARIGPNWFGNPEVTGVIFGALLLLATYATVSSVGLAVRTVALGASALLMPAYKLYPYRSQWHRYLRVPSSEVTLGVLGAALVIGGGIFIFDWIVHSTAVTVVFGTVVAIAFAVTLMRKVSSTWREHRAWRADARTLRQLQQVRGDLQRKEIARVWDSLKSEKGREVYVGLLRDARVRGTGAWPNGEPPNINNDPASTTLAQLEEGWLGLSR